MEDITSPICIYAVFIKEDHANRTICYAYNANNQKNKAHYDSFQY